MKIVVKKTQFQPNDITYNSVSDFIYKFFEYDEDGSSHITWLKTAFPILLEKLHESAFISDEDLVEMLPGINLKIVEE